MTAVPVHHTVDGPPDAPVLLLVNSLGSTLEMWEPLVPALAGRFRVIRYDLRGHGRSPVPPGPYDLADLGADAVALLDRVGVDRAHVCGLSLGGMVAMWLAAHEPSRVDRLVLCCTSARLGPPEAWAERARAVREGGTAAIADAVLDRWLTPSYAARHPGRVRALRAMLVATPADGYADCCGVIERMDLRADLAAITAPTLVVAGADDPATPPSHAEEIVAGVRDARLCVLPDAAHLAAAQRPDAVAVLVLAHLTAAANAAPVRTEGNP